MERGPKGIEATWVKLYHVSLIPSKCRYSSTHFVNLEALKNATYPVDIFQFESMVAQQCLSTRTILQKQLVSPYKLVLIVLSYVDFVLHRWVEDCGEVFRAHKDGWAHLIPTQQHQRPVLAEHFFNCACSLMAHQLREAMEASLGNFLSFLSQYQVRSGQSRCFKTYILQPALFVFSAGRE